MRPSSLLRPAAGAGLLLLMLQLPAAAQQRASPRDTVRAVVGGANLLVDYSRPSMRGREIFGGLVPWGQPWRTGADLPTTLTTDRPLLFGETVLPAGTHAFYTVPNPNAWTLLFMKAVPQWGIPYPGDAQIFARADMTVAPLSAAVEMLEIGIDTRGNGGVLRVRWDRTEASIPFTVRR